MTDVPHPELITTRRNVALGKFDAFRRECRRLARLVKGGVIDRTAAADTLVDTAEANFLPDIFGEETVDRILGDAFALPAVEERAA